MEAQPLYTVAITQISYRNIRVWLGLEPSDPLGSVFTGELHLGPVSELGQKNYTHKKPYRTYNTNYKLRKHSHWNPPINVRC